MVVFTVALTALPLAAKDAESVAAALGGVRSVLGAAARGGSSVPCSPTTAPSSPTRARSPRSSARGPARRGCSTATPGAATRRRLRAQPRRDQEAAAQGPRPQVRPAGPGGPVAGDVARELRAPRRARLRDARPRFRAMLGDDAEALLDAYGVEDVPVEELDLTPGLIARAREERGDAPLS